MADRIRAFGAPQTHITPGPYRKEKMCHSKVSAEWISYYVSRAAETGQASMGTSHHSLSSESFIFTPILILSVLAFQG